MFKLQCSVHSAIKDHLARKNNDSKVSLLDRQFSSLPHGLTISHDFYAFLIYSVATLDTKELQ